MWRLFFASFARSFEKRPESSKDRADRVAGCCFDERSSRRKGGISAIAGVDPDGRNPRSSCLRLAVASREEWRILHRTIEIEAPALGCRGPIRNCHSSPISPLTTCKSRSAW